MKTNKCVDCGKLICKKSIRCRECANSKQNNPNWQGGKDEEKYSDFDREIRRSIQFRDKFTCQICGVKQIQFKTDKLEVHHIDYIKTHTYPKNLVALCKSCHIRTNYDREYWIKFFTDLFKKKGLI